MATQQVPGLLHRADLQQPGLSVPGREVIQKSAAAGH
jgi:hypothetical protein